MDEKNISNGQQTQQKDIVTENAPSRGQETLQQLADSDITTSPVNGHESGDVNMEATISAEDVMRAGGFGATDGIGSLLPTAIDFTDFEASLRDARDFEGESEKPLYPGLGYKANETDSGGKPSDVRQQ
ncbi:hypothetical protein GUJ93_ZPchr0005g15552 [Zizania palustris]|uniref:Uncharacterized protein n=1 Tax=Zizania palustris TaxID=103762 RepID=A0A8J5SGK7_ZIZPA|nr:hypothetical protein GUJ93_ZPchr0005g15552 [Zizania palustris]KAG8068188.1 hypothetical protein GUJ93_ZPchr0005g15552 [Zizania palustris]